MQVQGRSVLVTGASRGLGAALARELARRGAQVVAAARDGAALERVVGEICGAGGTAHAVVADIANKDAIEPLAGTAAALVGPIDVLVHNAGALGPAPLRPLLDTECEDLSAVLDVNVVGPFRLTRAVMGSMLLRDRGLVVGLTSDAAVNAYPRWGAYSASKIAFEHMLRVWAAELEGTGVRAISVDPGDMDTEMYHRAIPGADRSTLQAPTAVAERLADLIEAADAVPNGARIALPSWSPAEAVR